MKVSHTYKALKLNVNMFFLLETIEFDDFKKIIERAAIKLVSDLNNAPKSEKDKDYHLKNIFINMFQYSYSVNNLEFFIKVTEILESKGENQVLYRLYRDLIKPIFLNKLTSDKYFNQTMRILEFYLISNINCDSY